LAASIFAATAAFVLANVSAEGPPAPPEEPAPWVKPAIDGVLDLFKQRSIVALGDAHGLAQEEVFYSELVRDPRFADEVGNVVVEFGGEASQDIVDRYLAGENVPLTELRRVWTETAGWIPGATSLGYINFYASVRSANLKLAPEHRIKVWLGDPKIDWSTIHSFQEIQPYVLRRDDNFFRVISENILEKRQKTLLIIGIGHLFDFVGGPESLSDKINKTYPNALAIVSPFIGYIEPECNAKFVAQAKGWPVPAVVGPVLGTRLKTELRLPGCNYIPRELVEQLKKEAAAVPPSGVQLSGKPPSADDMIESLSGRLSGANGDALLYLGPPETLTQSPIDPGIYIDPDYFNEESRRLQCCTPEGKPLDWDQLLQRNSLVPRRYGLR